MLGEKRIVQVKGKYLVKSGTICGVVYQGAKSNEDKYSKLGKLCEGGRDVR